MSEARRLKPVTAPTLQCDAPFPSDSSTYTTAYWERRKQRAKDKGWDVTRCLNHSAYKIGDKYLCRQHASSEALRILLNEETP